LFSVLSQAQERAIAAIPTNSATIRHSLEPSTSPPQEPSIVSRGGFPSFTPSQENTASLRPHNGFTRAAVESDSTDDSAFGKAEDSQSKLIAPMVTVGSSLAIVLALFCGLVWVSRRFGNGAAGAKALPAAAITPLGHVMLDPRTKLLLVKCGRRILVLSQTAAGLTPISEVTQPDEVRELLASCSAEARQAFESTLRELEQQPAQGFTEPTHRPAPPRRLFATA